MLNSCERMHISGSYASRCSNGGSTWGHVTPAASQTSSDPTWLQLTRTRSAVDLLEREVHIVK
jgi:hypothetical protein